MKATIGILDCCNEITGCAITRQEFYGLALQFKLATYPPKPFQCSVSPHCYSSLSSLSGISSTRSASSGGMERSGLSGSANDAI